MERGEKIAIWLCVLVSIIGVVHFIYYKNYFVLLVPLFLIFGLINVAEFFIVPYLKITEKIIFKKGKLVPISNFMYNQLYFPGQNVNQKNFGYFFRTSVYLGYIFFSIFFTILIVSISSFIDFNNFENIFSIGGSVLIIGLVIIAGLYILLMKFFCKNHKRFSLVRMK
jgi:hypothetical protein